VKGESVTVPPYLTESMLIRAILAGEGVPPNLNDAELGLFKALQKKDAELQDKGIDPVQRRWELHIHALHMRGGSADTLSKEISALYAV
jgi:hypothetical protein